MGASNSEQEHQKAPFTAPTKQSPPEAEYEPDIWWPGVVVGLSIALACYASTFQLSFEHVIDPEPARRAAALIGFMAVAWLTRAIPMAATSLLPVTLMPLMGILPLGLRPVVGPAGESLKYSAATAYMSPIIWLFLGGFVLAQGIERWGLHRRIALTIISWIGKNPKGLVLGFMLASCFLSMWMLNTSVTLMLMPICMAVITGFDNASTDPKSRSATYRFSVALLLGIAFASSIGGMATPIGTAPNGLYMQQIDYIPNLEAPSFLAWMQATIPIVIVLLPITWWILCRGEFPNLAENTFARIQEVREKLPRITEPEVRMLVLFICAALLWMTRRDLWLGEYQTASGAMAQIRIPGWWHLLPVSNVHFIGDGSVAMLVCIAAFCIPSGVRKGQTLLNWDYAQRIPWDILLLLGAGISIAQAFQYTGLAEAVGQAAQPILTSVPAPLAVILVCASITFLTEITSNTAMAAVFLPILANVCLNTDIDPRLLMYPATLAASCAFMLPIATPPNAVVFGARRFSIMEMARIGFILNIISIVVISAHSIFILPLLG